jgi:hypothetical protein
MPAGVAVVLQQHRDFSQPLCLHHNPLGGNLKPIAEHATREKPAPTHGKEATTNRRFTPASPRSLLVLPPCSRASKQVKPPRPKNEPD